MTELNKSYNPEEVEEKWYRIWDEGGYFHADNTSNKKPFTIVMPPPNVTGVLHMGHALDQTLQDILIRYKRMSGFEVLYIPGTDHAGIATQTVVEKHLIIQENKKRKDFTREAFVEKIWQWKAEKESKIINQIQKLGTSCDWERLRFTMDEMSNRAVRKMFKKMYDEKMIYLGDYLINWDPKTQTALSDDEVEHEERDSFLWYFCYPIKDEKSYAIIATTRPETMLGDTAICVNPDDERYKSLIGKTAILPIVNREIPIIADSYVDPKFGTGMLKITPAHDFNDYQIGLKHGLEMINIMTDDGLINENGAEFKGMRMHEARDAIVKKMTHLNLFDKKIPHKLRVGVSYRSKAIVEPYLSKQWFVKLSAFKEKLISAVEEKRVDFIPKHWEKTYFHWIENIRDWCISRQLWWGHRIPVWYNKKDPSKMICSAENETPKEVLENPDSWYQDDDVLDTWFSSALWPMSTLGWPDATKDFEKFYPTSILITGHDIIFFWIARMILMGEYATKSAPFEKTFIHGLIYGKSYWREHEDGTIFYVDSKEKELFDLGEKVPKDVSSKWEKMSKSKGNVIDPIEIIEKYGADAIRIALTSSVTNARQIDLDRRRFEEYKNFANKLWNAARFIFINIDENKDLSKLSSEDILQGLNFSKFRLEDFWIISLLNKLNKNFIKALDDLSFDKIVSFAYHFFWDEFCSFYLEVSKKILFGKEGDEDLRKNKQKILTHILCNFIRLLHPITPFITEEIFSELKKRFKNFEKFSENLDNFSKDFINAINSKLCIVSPYPKVLDEKFINEKAESDFNFIKNIIKAIRNIRAEIKIPASSSTDVYFHAKNEEKAILEKNQNLIKALIKINEIKFLEKEKDDSSSSSFVNNTKIYVPIPKEFLEKEIVRLNKEKVNLEKKLENFEKKLNNKNFLENAPENIVSQIKEQFLQTKNNFEEILENLKKFSK